MNKRFLFKTLSVSCLCLSFFTSTVAASANTWLKLVPVVGGYAGDSIVPSFNNSTNQAQNLVMNSQDSDGFNAGLAVNNSTLNTVPDKFNSAAKIRQFLSSQGSFLANYLVETSFEPDDDMLAKNPELNKFQGQKMDFSEFIWQLSTSSLGNHCSTINANVCVNSTEKPINPGFILGMIQRESGLVYGSNAKSNPNSDNTKFLIERATGYLCAETSDKTRSCWDENPDWKYYKGLFRQTFYMTRNLLLNSKRCDLEGVNVYGRKYKVGNSVVIDGREIVLENSITCALYIYTPHAFAQKSLYKVLNNFGTNIGSYAPTKTPTPGTFAPIVFPQIKSPSQPAASNRNDNQDSNLNDSRSMFIPGSVEEQKYRVLKINQPASSNPVLRLRMEPVE